MKAYFVFTTKAFSFVSRNGWNLTATTPSRIRKWLLDLSHFWSPALAREFFTSSFTTTTWTYPHLTSVYQATGNMKIRLRIKQTQTPNKRFLQQPFHAAFWVFYTDSLCECDYLSRPYAFMRWSNKNISCENAFHRWNDVSVSSLRTRHFLHFQPWSCAGKTSKQGLAQLPLQARVQQSRGKKHGGGGRGEGRRNQIKEQSPGTRTPKEGAYVKHAALFVEGPREAAVSVSSTRPWECAVSLVQTLGCKRGGLLLRAIT